MNKKQDLTNMTQSSSLNMQDQDNPELNEKKCSKTLKIVIISLIVLLIAAAIVCTIVFIQRGDKEKNKNKTLNEEGKVNEDDNNENSNPKRISSNLITAKYYIEEGKNINLLNPALIGLKEDEYSIKYSINEKRLRNLNSISNFIIKGEDSGILKVNITFKENLKSMLGMFKGCENLIDVDLTNLNTSRLENINSLFEGCNNLENVNFFNKQLYKIRETENLFNGCENLVEIENLDKINIPTIRKANNMFKNCKVIRNINLSSIYLDKAENAKDIFHGCDKLEILDICNFGEINNELFGSLKDLSKIKIKVKIDVVIENGIEINKLENDYEIIQNCQIGENQKM